MGSASCTNCFSFSVRGQTYSRKHSICMHLFKAGMNAVASHHGRAEFSCCRFVFVIGGGFQRAPHKREGCYGDGGHSKNKTLLISLICNCSHAAARAFFNVRRVGSVFSTFIIIQLLRICPLIYMDPPPV